MSCLVTDARLLGNVPKSAQRISQISLQNPEEKTNDCSWGWHNGKRTYELHSPLDDKRSQNHIMYKRFRHFLSWSGKLKRRWKDNNKKKREAGKRTVCTRGRSLHVGCKESRKTATLYSLFVDNTRPFWRKNQITLSVVGSNRKWPHRRFRCRDQPQTTGPLKHCGQTTVKQHPGQGIRIRLKKKVSLVFGQF